MNTFAVDENSACHPKCFNKNQRYSGETDFLRTLLKSMGFHCRKVKNNRKLLIEKYNNLY